MTAVGMFCIGEGDAVRKYLLDTHLLIWVLLDSPQLSSKARVLFAAQGSRFYYSAASIIRYGENILGV